MGCTFPGRAGPRPAVRAMHGRPRGPARTDVPLPRAGTICPRGHKDTGERHGGHSRPRRRRPPTASSTVRVRRAGAVREGFGTRFASVAELHTPSLRIVHYLSPDED